MASVKKTDFKLGRFVFSFVTFRDALVIPAFVVETLLGYNTGALLKSILGWSDRQLLKISGFGSSENGKTSGYNLSNEKDVKEFNVICNKVYGEPIGEPGSNEGGSLLTLTGLRQVLQMSNSKGAKLFRTEVYKNEDFRQLIGLPLPKQTKQKEFDFTAKSDGEKNTLKDIFFAFEQLKRLGAATPAEIKQMGKRVVDMLGTELAMERGVQNYLQDKSRATSKPIGIGQNIVSTAQGNVSIFTGNSHPKYEGYLTATGIGAPYGLKADLVKKYLKAFALKFETDLPNNLAKKWVSANDGQFPLVDDHGFIVFKHPKLDAFAVWAGMEGNTFNWRNFWSPDIVQAINAMIEKDKNIKPNKTLAPLETLNPFGSAKKATVDGQKGGNAS